MDLKIMNNIFAIATKELVTDAFFAWLFEEFKTDNELRKYQKEFLSKLKINGVSDEVCVERAEKQKKNTDLIVTLKDGEEYKKILFENKVHSTIHSKQLKRYKDSFPDCHKYIYMKLGFVYHSERKEAKKFGYDIVSAQDIESALHSFKNYNQIISQYYQYIKCCHVDRCDDMFERMKVNDSSVYSDIYSQRKFLSDLHESIYNLVEYTSFKSKANNGGTPWTHLCIAKKEAMYGDKSEYIFWRIDKKSGRYYIRLNQYSYIDKSFKDKKMAELAVLRELFNKLVKGTNLVTSSPSNQGLKESEIGLLYFDENSYFELVDNIEHITLDFVKSYGKMSEVCTSV